jgi:hypothetical protein
VLCLLFNNVHSNAHLAVLTHSHLPACSLLGILYGMEYALLIYQLEWFIGQSVDDGHCSCLSRFLGPEPALGVSRCNIRRKLICWRSGQHRANWHDLANTLRQARELISGPCPGTRTKFLSFDRNQSRVVTGLLTGHNTLRRHLHLMGLLDSPLCRKYGVKEESSAHILCECEALAALRCRYLGSFFLEPEDIKSLSLGAIWSFSKAAGLPWYDMIWGTEGLYIRPRCIGARWLWTQSKSINQSIMPEYAVCPLSTCTAKCLLGCGRTKLDKTG